MKKNYFIWSVILGLLSGAGNAQSAYMDGDVQIYNSPNTLMYFGQDLELKTDDMFFENDGNVYIRGEYRNTNIPESDVNKGKNFLSTWTGLTNYGQVIINQANQALGWLTMEKKSQDPTKVDWAQYSIPYLINSSDPADNDFINRFGAFLDHQVTLTPKSRYQSIGMVWNNMIKSQQAYDHIASNNTGNLSSSFQIPGYYILNMSDENLGGGGTMSDAIKLWMTNDIVEHSGQPANLIQSATINGEQYSDFGDWVSWKDTKNHYNEKYYTYTDEAIKLGGDVNFGKWQYQFGNPYTSNIDLSLLEDGEYGVQDLVAVVKGKFYEATFYWDDQEGGYDGGTGHQYDNVYKATYNNGDWAGASEALIIRPFEPFYVYVEGDTAMSQLEFNDELKTFEMMPSKNVDAGKFNNNDFYQLSLNMADIEGNMTGNTVYVVVSSKVTDGEANNFESANNNFSDDAIGIYLGQENPSGEKVHATNDKYDINAVSPEFVGKPIPLFVNSNENEISENHLLYADLFQGSIFNKLNVEDGNFSDGNSFFFYDIKNDVLLPINTTFVYEIEVGKVPANNYELYWNQGPEGSMGVIDTFANRAIVYKDGDIHKVRFNPEWKQADVTVYDVSGKRINTYNNVNTQNELEIRLLANGAYIVKILAENGDVYTQKILK